MASKTLPRKTRFKLALMASERTISDWAKANEVSRTHLYAVLNGEREPGAELAASIEAVLQQSAA